MILNGNSRGNGQELAHHLLNVRDNEHVHVHQLRGFVADDLAGAFDETQAISLGTACEQYLFSLSLNPPPMENVSVTEFEAVIGTIEQRLGLVDQPRAIVFHEKYGRHHAHCVWSRIDVAQMKAINLPHYKRKLTDISRDLFIQYGWDMPDGLRNHEDRSQLNYSHEEAGQAKRVKRDPAKLKALFKSCWEQSDSKSAFAAALHEHRFSLARGDRRGFVAVDQYGEVYSLSRWCGVKAKELRAKLGSEAELVDIETALQTLRGSAALEKPNRLDQLTKAHAEKVSTLVIRQRKERKALLNKQAARKQQETLEAKHQIPTGPRAVWARLTGERQKLLDQLALKAKERHSRDRTEMQALIERHLGERRELDRQFEFQKAQLALEADAQRYHSTYKIYRPDPNQPLLLPREKMPFSKAQLKRNPELILSHLSEKQARFTRNDIVRGLAKLIDEPLELRVAIDTTLASPELVSLYDGDKQTYTTREFEDVESALNSRTSELSKLGGFAVKKSAIAKAIKQENKRLKCLHSSALTKEQEHAIKHVLSPNQLSVVVGLAGTGKSTLLSVAREAWEQQGYKVYGATLAGKAADSLESASGISARTLASIQASWENGYEPVSAGDVVVIDEAGMIGTRQLNRVTERLQQLGCKIVLVGDPDQLQPIEAGEPFRNIAKNQGVAQLTEIRRQNEDWQRQASTDLAQGYTQKALQDYADHKAVHNHDERDHAIAALVDDFVQDWQNHGDSKSRLALAHRRKDVHAINQAVRAAKKQSEPNKQEVLFQTDHGPRAFTKDDRIIFTSNNRELGVRNGMLGTVTKATSDNLTVQLDAENETSQRKVTIRPSEYSAFDHGYAVTIHRAQGCTVDHSFVLSSKTLNKNLAYVAMTRHKDDMNFYTAPDIEMKQSFDRSRIQLKRRNALKRSR